MIKVSVVGAKGRMGSHVVEAVNKAEDTQLALALDAGDDLTQVTTDNTDVVVEFTVPSVSLNNVLTLIGQGVDVVVGTTGWTDEKLAQVKSAIANGPKPETQKVFIAPNFAISAVLADYFATKAAKYFESAEVIELHHPTKVDAPSGTAIHTAHGIAEARKAAGLAPVPDATETDGGSRGQVVDGIHVHAVRLRGLTPTRKCSSATRRAADHSGRQLRPHQLHARRPACRAQARRRRSGWPDHRPRPLPRPVIDPQSTSSRPRIQAGKRAGTRITALPPASGHNAHAFSNNQGT